MNGLTATLPIGAGRFEYGWICFHRGFTKIKACGPVPYGTGFLLAGL